jgi:hypothetical protein
MLAADTNPIVRLLANDGAAQTRRAAALLASEQIFCLKDRAA